MDAGVEAPEVLTRVENGVGRITLNRPKALHALTLGMCDAMATALREWEKDPSVQVVMLDHAEGTRGFCAGGDIRMVAQSGRTDGRAADDFFRVEYTLNTQIKRFTKPFVAILDGITMGGGVGISVHGSHRVATERTIFAMPETGIGLFPDVGGGWFLPRLDGELGTWLALTGAQLRGADVLVAGIATHYVASEEMADLKAEILADPGSADVIISRRSRPAPEPSFAPYIDVMNRCFAGGSMAEIVSGLNADGSEWAIKQAEILTKRSPLSMSVALKQLRQGREMASFEDVMRMEYRVACHITRTNDFSEGVRAVIEDKDNAPKWQPETIEAVVPSMIEHMFDGLGSAELQLPN